MSIEHGPFDHSPEKKEGEFKYNAVFVLPSYENNKHRTGLMWDSRFRLLAAASLFESGKTRRIIVGGAQIRDMKESFVDLMKRELIRRGVPATEIDVEEYSFDTASQIEWMQKNIAAQEGKTGVITDPEQAKHVQALLEGYDLRDKVDVLTTEDIIRENVNNKHFVAFFEKLHKSPYWMKWKLREKALELFTRYFDPKGEKMQKITSGRKKI
jgi:uncharacterized protein YajQ (UPF0234 family)